MNNKKKRTALEISNEIGFNFPKETNMKLVVLHNDLDDYVLYIDGKPYQDIDYRWAECIMWLSDTITSFNVEFREVNLHRSKFPDKIDKEYKKSNVIIPKGHISLD